MASKNQSISKCKKINFSIRKQSKNNLKISASVYIQDRIKTSFTACKKHYGIQITIYRERLNLRVNLKINLKLRANLKLKAEYSRNNLKIDSILLKIF